MSADAMVVDTEVLRRHAARVQQVASDLATAKAAAATTSLHSGAFGLLCSFLPPIVQGVDDAARQAISAVHEASDAAVGELGSMARSIDAVDERVQEALRGLLAALDR
ncbi:type VII secretion target [Cellulomonas chengniuliangii]|uniref:Type VII secretion target n=1 Tax=Cellulomonas chengniuliangii TaxID=2968084 RepID=A0ABY5KXN4_9CELL|nr:type VII secretion target [Cellulomonas chengniuliangii]MCC2307976.1 hypothetical protein [Cellulomonas chengniuliangii]UUI75275.1 type VII secretion target [Cellulomonas chengniuliangii]